MNLFPPFGHAIPLLMASSGQKEWVINNTSNLSFRMCIGVDNYINSVGNKTKFEIKLTKLFIHKVMAKDSVCHHF